MRAQPPTDPSDLDRLADQIGLGGAPGRSGPPRAPGPVRRLWRAFRNRPRLLPAWVGLLLVAAHFISAGAGLRDASESRKATTDALQGVAARTSTLRLRLLDERRYNALQMLRQQQALRDTGATRDRLTALRIDEDGRLRPTLGGPGARFPLNSFDPEAPARLAQEARRRSSAGAQPSAIRAFVLRQDPRHERRLIWTLTMATDSRPLRLYANRTGRRLVTDPDDL